MMHMFVDIIFMYASVLYMCPTAGFSLMQDLRLAKWKVKGKNLSLSHWRGNNSETNIQE